MSKASGGKKRNRGSRGRGGKRGGGGGGAKVKRADREDRHVLYELSVQGVEAEIDFVDETFRELRGRDLSTLREDFAGTCNTSCEFVRRRETNFAVGVDFDEETLAWGREHHVEAELDEEQQGRVAMVLGDVRKEDGMAALKGMKAPEAGKGFDAVLAMNFSYFILQKRAELREYFARVRKTLKSDGILFLDCYGGYESYSECEDPRKVEPEPETGVKPFTYVWDQARYNPISGEMDCKIHFHFPDGSKMREAFTYTWRMWTMPELREILEEAGFRKSTVYWEGADEDDPTEGNGEYSPTEEGDPDPAWVCYIVAEK